MSHKKVKTVMAGYSGWQLGRSFLHRLSCHGCIFCIGLCRQNYQPVSRKNTKFCCVLLYKIHFLIPDVSPQYLAVYSVTHQLAGKAGHWGALMNLQLLFMEAQILNWQLKVIASCFTVLTAREGVWELSVYNYLRYIDVLSIQIV